MFYPYVLGVRELTELSTALSNAIWKRFYISLHQWIVWHHTFQPDIIVQTVIGHALFHGLFLEYIPVIEAHSAAVAPMHTIKCDPLYKKQPYSPLE